MSDFLYTGAWQLFDTKSGICFGMVSGIIDLDGNVRVGLFFDAVKTHIVQNEAELVVELAEEWAKVFAEEVNVIVVRTEVLHKMFQEGRLGPNSVYPDSDALGAGSDLNDNRASVYPVDRVGRGSEIALQVGEHIIVDATSNTLIGSVAASGPTRGSGKVTIRIYNSATSGGTMNRDSLHLELPRSSAEALSKVVRQVAVELSELRSISSRYGSRST